MPLENDQGAGVGAGMLLTIAALAAATAVLAVLVVTRHGAHHATTAPRTVFVTRAAPTAPAQTHPAATTAPAATAEEVAATTTTSPTTTAPPTAAVPSVSGDLQSALQAVRNAGFSAVVHYVPSSQPRGAVVAQSPAGGTREPTTAQITINVSAGAGTETVPVPSTIGMSIPQAVSAVQGAGLHLVLLRRAISDQSQAGKVVGQTPPPGQRAPKNSRVVVYMGAFKG